MSRGKYIEIKDYHTYIVWVCGDEEIEELQFVRESATHLRNHRNGIIQLRPQ